MQKFQPLVSSPLIFIHGGPGLHTLMEAKLLGPLLKSQGFLTFFWNEPSSRRPQEDVFSERNSFKNWRQSIENRVKTCVAQHGPVHLVAHSFGNAACHELVARHPEWFRSYVMITPALDQKAVHLNLMKIAEQNFSLSGESEKAERLRVLRSESKEFFDSSMKEALRLVFQDPNLLPHYWVNSQARLQASNILSEPEAAPDLESFFSVMEDYAVSEYPFRRSVRSSVPTWVLLTKEDKVISAESEIAMIQELFEDVRISWFEKCGHYLHLDPPEKFVSELSHWLQEPRNES